MNKYRWVDNNGTIYGPFSKQEDGFPNAGEVIRHFRKHMGLTQIAFGLLLGLGRTQVYNMEHENQVPQNLSRRRLIADILKIPPVLLGVGVLGSYLVPLEEAHFHTSVTSYSVQEAEEYLDTAWEYHRFADSSEVLPGLLRWKARIREGQNFELLHRYEILLLTIGRVKRNYVGVNLEDLINLAKKVDNPDALGVSLYQRGRVYYEQNNYHDALTDINAALSEVRQASPQVRSLTLVGSGPILAHHARDKEGVREVLENLDDAYRYIDQAKSYPDPFHVKFDESRYFIDRASAIIPLLRIDSTLIDEVWSALDTAKEKTDEHYALRRASIEVLYAEAASHSGGYLSAVSTALDALRLAQAVDSVNYVKRLQDLYNKLAQTKVKDSSELRKLRVALDRK